MNIKVKKILIYDIWAFIIILFVVVMTAGLIIGHSNENKYEMAKQYIESGYYNEAVSILNDLNYKDPEGLKEKAQKGIIYLEACELLNNKQFEEAIERFEVIEDFEDSNDQIKEANYQLAIQYFDNKEYDRSKQLFKELSKYGDSETYLDMIDREQLMQLTESTYNIACDLLEKKDYVNALENFNLILGHKDSLEKAELCQRFVLSHVIAGGIYNSFAVSDDEEVLFAGYNYNKQCNVDSWENIVSVDGYGVCTLGLTENGNVKVTGDTSEMNLDDVAAWDHIIDIAVGQNFIVALKYDGTVVSDGHKTNERCNVADWKNVVDIDAGWSFTVGLTRDGELLFTGVVPQEMKDDYANTKEEWKDVVKIVASGGDPYHDDRGKGHIVGLKSDGTVIAIGDKSQGQCDVNDEDWKQEKIIDIAAGDWYTVGLTEGGKILITGKNKSGRKYIEQEKIDEWEQEEIIDIAAGYGQTLVLKDDGSIDAIWFQDEERLSNDVSNWEKRIKR